MDNIYLAKPARLLGITRHTPAEWSFLVDYKAEEEPGRFVMASLPDAGEVPISISGFSGEGIELTIRNAGHVTSRLFRLREGDLVYIRGPYGSAFPLDEFTGRHLLIIAGGSGIAAVKPLIEYFIRADRQGIRRLDVLAGFKSPKQILFREEIDRWKRSDIGSKFIDVELTVDNDEEYAWLGSIGFVVNFIKNVNGIGADTRVIVVGPPLMMRNSVNELLNCGVREGNIWLSFERHMKCGVGKCGHCRIRDKYVCVDGPVFNYVTAKELID